MTEGKEVDGQIEAELERALSLDRKENERIDWCSGCMLNGTEQCSFCQEMNDGEPSLFMSLRDKYIHDAGLSCTEDGRDW